MGSGIMNLTNTCVRVLVFHLMKGKTQEGRKFSVSSVSFSSFFEPIISEKIKSTIDFFPVIKIRLVGVTENDKDTPEGGCRFELMDCEKAPN